METHSAGAARTASAAAVLIPSVLVVMLSVVLILGDDLSTNPWPQGGVVIGGFLFCLITGVSIARHPK